jgi:arginyl-tRNA synthetase
MLAPEDVLTPFVSSAIERAFGPEFHGADPVLRPSQYADVQVNAALALAKRLGEKPRDVAARIVEHLDLDGICDSIEVSGPGFVNLTLSDAWISAQTRAAAADPRLGVVTVEPHTVVIDYSHPNVAKEMHVGHLRTTVVGDCLARVLEHLGHRVVRQNHIGDWGTPFGMLIEHLLDVGEDSDQARLIESDPSRFYQAARSKFDADEAFAARSRSRVVALQGGDTATLATWERLVTLSRHYFNAIYSRLGVTLTDDDLAGESTYNDDLASVCDELVESGIAVESEGALCVFLDGYTGREGNSVPLIVRKSDGAYGYATTDLATVRHRIRTLGADRMLYVIGAPQALHLDMVWATARLAGWLPPEVVPVHVRIGNVLGEDRKILRTRSGSPLRLMALLDEAVAAARAVLDEHRASLDEETRAAVAAQVGMAAVKYADLSVAHDSEYVFDLERMIAPTGNTGPYIQYAAARVRSIFRNAGLDPTDPLIASAPIVVGAPEERALCLQLLEMGPTLLEVGQHLEPHRLCGYLFSLAQTFSVFYERCPVMKAKDETVRASRLALSAATLRTLVTGLDLLGIEAPARM